MSGAIRVLAESGQLEQHTFQIGGTEDAIAAPVLPTTEPLPVRPAAKLNAQPNPTASIDAALTTGQLISQLKARLRVVEREIKARQALESERGQLNRLLSAAKQERDNVRRLRSAG